MAPAGTKTPTAKRQAHENVLEDLQMLTTQASNRMLRGEGRGKEIASWEVSLLQKLLDKLESL